MNWKWYLRLCAAAVLAVLMSIPASASGPGGGRRGALLQATEIPGAGRYGSVYRILYRSSTSRNTPVIVSGLVMIPDGPAPAAGRPVVSWGHGTTGVANDCAPSLNADRAMGETLGLKPLLREGYVVVSTDYPGLGSPGVHPYLDGISAARAMIDAVRAVRQLARAHAGSRYAAWGFSQGGHGALFVASIAKSYAPELTLVGSAAASAPTQLRRLLRADAQTPAGRVIAAYAIWSWQRFYGAPVAEIADAKTMSVIDGVARVCSLNALENLQLGLDSLAFPHSGFLKSEPSDSTIWGRLIAKNSAPETPRDVPLLILQGGVDQIVEAPITRRYVKRLCESGRRVTYVEMAGVDHGTAARRGADMAVKWLTDRFSGQPAASNCPAAAD
ncbi:alpha/beta fold hydrolase [Ancylobacter sp. VKM B-3255]|uniref:Alpha/beta fold hydrolase n=1 Tax=Ancylobacter radicis TaxID=2836179 RepID=A0ABS5R7A6_9HYPH|nr:alpha/beta fold hydrolase [Ancylobacter radicis]